IVLSEAYQRGSLSTPNNKADDRFYARYIVRPLPPVVLVDAVAKVTGVPEKFDGAEARAIALGDARVKSEPLDLLGRCTRQGEAGPSVAASLPLALHKINGDWLNKKIAAPEGSLHKMLAAQK